MLPLLEAQVGSQHDYVAYGLLGMGDVYLGLHQPTQAVAVLERALSLGNRGVSMRSDLYSGICFFLAQALWDSGQSRARAVTLALKARELSAGAQAPYEKAVLAKMDAWLSERKIARK